MACSAMHFVCCYSLVFVSLFNKQTSTGPVEGLEVLANADPGEKLAYFGQDFNLKALDQEGILEVLQLEDQLEGQMGFGFQKCSELQPLFSFYIMKVI